MRISHLAGERVKDSPSLATSKSHILLHRAGYIKQVSNGIYSLLPPAQRVSLKIQNIIREEMNKIEGQEVLMPVVMPRELWEESGRYSLIGNEMVRFKDRTGHDMLLGMTHEEAAVHMIKNTIKSYSQLPLMIYQIQTKFRDEARSRAGLIRVREFTMKDAYSFHATQQDLEVYYQRMLKAYINIYTRVGLKNIISVASDTGMMGGKVAHEFMFLNEIGEDSIAICSHCGQMSNVEVATGLVETKTNIQKPLKQVYTGKAKTIEEICTMFKIDASQTCKAVCYAIKGDESNIVVAFIRGDLEVNEAKLKCVLGKDIVQTKLGDSGLVAGNIGPINLKANNLTVVYDASLKDEKCLIAGANKDEYHIINLSFSRDMNVKFVDFSKAYHNQTCANCRCGKFSISRGVEIGNIFQLGTKYTASMGMTVHSAEGEEINPIMGCYGIGVGRTLACIAEESCDKKGLCWPFSVAPWHVYLCPLKYENKNVKTISEKLYEDLEQAGIEVLYDDREISAGIKFAESELVGIPLRVIVSPRGLENNMVEFSYRKTGEKFEINIDQIVERVKAEIKKNM
ncbi:MAG: proline--tRNA ligase [Clostridia bacterium]